MSYTVNPAVNVSPDVDAKYSVRKWLHTDFPSLTILLERDRRAFTRPAVRLDHSGMMARSEEISSGLWEETRNVRIRYYGSSLLSCEQFVSSASYALRQRKRLIANVLKDWSYPQPTLTAVASGSLGAGTYYVRVAGQALSGDWSLASAVNSVVLTANQKINIIIPQVGGLWGYFKTFRVYLGTSSNAVKLLAEVTAANTMTTQYNANALPAGGAAVPATTSEMGFRFHRVGATEATYLEDPVVDGLWDAVLSFRMKFVVGRSHVEHVVPVAVNHTITIPIS